MAINMMCMNSKCKYYWEDSCTRNIMEERIVIDSDGLCETFTIGESEWYENNAKCGVCGTIIGHRSEFSSLCNECADKLKRHLTEFKYRELKA